MPAGCGPRLAARLRCGLGGGMLYWESWPGSRRGGICRRDRARWAGGGHEMLLLSCQFSDTVNLCQNTDMSQDGAGVDLETSLGYLLKEASSALRAAMEEVLRPLGMSVTHYSCLELLAQRPGLSNSELARGAFVTRQTMNVLLQALERDGYVTRPAEAPVGKVLPTRLTPRGQRSLEKATVAVRSVEVRMLAGMTETEQSDAFRILQSMTRSLRDGNHGA